MADLQWVLAVVDQTSGPAKNVTKSLAKVDQTIRHIDTSKATKSVQKLSHAAKDSGKKFAKDFAPFAVAALAAVTAAAGAAALAFAKFAAKDIIDAEGLDWRLKQLIKDTKQFDAAIADVQKLSQILGSDPDEIQKQLTTLVGKGHDVASAFKIIQGQADLAALGHDANALIGAFTDLDDKGKLGAKSIAAMGAAGIDTKKIREILNIAGEGDDVEAIEKAIKDKVIDAAALQAAALKAITDTTGKKLGGAAKDFSKNTLPGILKALETAPGRIMNAIDAGAATAPIKKILGQIVAALDPDSKTGKKLIALINRIAGAVGDALGDIDLDKILDSLDEAITVLDRGFTAAQAFFGSMVDGALGGYRAVKKVLVVLDTLQGKTQKGEKTSTELGKAWEKIGTVLGVVGGVLVAVGGRLMASFVAPISYLIDLLTGIYDSLGDLVEWVNDIVNVFDIDGIGAGMKKIGTDIVSGLWKGITDAWKWMLGKFDALLDLLPDAAKKALGIASPAKAMMPIGKFSAQGVIAGWEGEAANLNATVQTTLAPSTLTGSSLAGGGAAMASAGGVVVHAQINVDASGAGGDGQKLAAQMRPAVVAMLREALVEAGVAA